MALSFGAPAGRNPASMPDTYYESRRAVCEYLLFHYGAAETLLPRGFGPSEAAAFPERCGRLHERLPLQCRRRALDVGCATGRSAYELSAAFEACVGIDNSDAFIEAANGLAATGSASIDVPEEGELMQTVRIELPRSARPDRVAFRQGDAMALDPELGAFDFVLMANLIDRLPDPARCLEAVHRFVAPGGGLAITSPYTWLEAYTPKSKWLGGVFRGGQPRRSLETIEEILAPRFQLQETLDLPFVIREHSRKTQFSVAEASLWLRR